MKEKKYILEKIKDDEYLCTSTYKDIYIEDYFHELEHELVSTGNNNDAIVHFDITINKENQRFLTTTFKKNILNYNLLLNQ